MDERDEVMQGVVERINHLLKQNNMTAKELVKKLEISKTAMSEWRSGKTKPSIESLLKISKIFDVPIDWLITGQKNITPEHRQIIDRLINYPDSDEKDRLLKMIDAFLEYPSKKTDS